MHHKKKGGELGRGQKYNAPVDSKHEEGGWIIAVLLIYVNPCSCNNLTKYIKETEDSRPQTTLKTTLALVSRVFEMWINTNENKSISHFNVLILCTSKGEPGISGMCWLPSCFCCWLTKPECLYTNISVCLLQCLIVDSASAARNAISMDWLAPVLFCMFTLCQSIHASGLLFFFFFPISAGACYSLARV